MLTTLVARRGLLLCLVALLIPTFTQAQEILSAPVPITPNNAAALTLHARLGSIQRGDLAWSPDGGRLAVGTSAGVRVYDFGMAGALPDAPAVLSIAGSQAVVWEDDDTLITGGIRYSADGTPLGETALPLDGRTFTALDGAITMTAAQMSVGLTLTVRQPGTSEAVYTLPLRNAQVLDVYFGDDTLMAALNVGNQVEVWDVYAVERLATLPLPPSRTFLNAALFDQSGTRLVVAAQDSLFVGGNAPFYGVALYDWRSGSPLIQLETDRPQISPDRRWLVVGEYLPDTAAGSGARYAPRLWDRVTGDFSSELAYHAQYDLLRFSGDGLTLVIQPISDPSSRSRPIAVLRLPTPAEAAAGDRPASPRRYGAFEFVHDLFLNHDGTLVAVQQSSRITLINLTNGAETLLDLPADALNIESSQLAFSPDSALALLRTWDGHHIFFDTTTGESLLNVRADMRVNAGWTHAAYWQAGDLIVHDLRGGQNQTFTQIDPFYGEPVAAGPDFAVFQGDDLAVYALESGDLIVRDAPERIHRSYFDLWPVQDLTRVLAAFERPPFIGYQAASADGQLVLQDISSPMTGSWLALRDSGAALLTEWSIGAATQMNAISLSPDGRWAAASLMPGTMSDRSPAMSLVLVWSVADLLADTFTHTDYGSTSTYSDAGLRGIIINVTETVRTLTFAPDGRYLAVAYAHPGGDKLSVFDLSGLDEVSGAVTLTGRTARRQKVVWADLAQPVFRPGGTALLARQRGDTTTWALIDLDFESLGDIPRQQSPATLATLPGAGPAAFSPDGALLAVIDDGMLAVYAADALGSTVTPLVRLALAVDAPVTQVAFTPDGTGVLVRDAEGVSAYRVGE